DREASRYSPSVMRMRGLARWSPAVCALGLALSLLTSLGLPATAHADWLTDLSRPFEEALTSGSWTLALAMMLAAGLLTSLTPCVYPMIAITVSIFGASQAKTKLHGAGLSTMYVLGMCALFTPLGL